MTWGSTPVTTTTLGANQYPASAVGSPDTPSGNFTVVAGYPGAYQDSNSNAATAAIWQVLTPRILQSNHAVTSSGGKTLTCAFANNNIKGNSIVVCVGMGEVEVGGGSPITLAITDSNSNTYTEVSKGSQSTTLEAAIFLSTYVSAGSNTVTVTIAGSGSSNTAIGVQIYEVYGLITPMSATDQSTNNSSAGSTSISLPSVSPVVPNEYAFMAIAAAGGTITAGTNWTLDSGSLAPVGGNLVSFGAESQALPTMAALTGTATLSASNAWAAALATFRAVILPIEGTVTVSNTNTNGQATMNNSSPVVIASDQSPVQTEGGFTEQANLSAGSLNAFLVPSTDVSYYKALSLHVTGTYSGTLSFFCSNDNVNFINLILEDMQWSQGVWVSATSETNAIFSGPVRFRYFKVQMTSYTSGTATGTLELYTLPAALSHKAFAQLDTGSNNAGAIQQALKNVAVPSTASNQVVKGSAGYLSGALVTSVPGSPVALNIYDNATTNSGTIIGTIPSTATVGTFWPFNMPALLGITAAKTANTPAVTLAYS